MPWVADPPEGYVDCAAVCLRKRIVTQKSVRLAVEAGELDGVKINQKVYVKDNVKLRTWIPFKYRIKG